MVISAATRIGGNEKHQRPFATLWFILLGVMGSSAWAALPQAGEKAPEWQLTSTDGHLVKFPEAAEGRPTIVVFWASWCPYCKALMPKLVEIKDSLPGEELQIFAVNFAEESGFTLGKKMKVMPFEFFLKGDDVAELYGVEMLPAFFIMLDNQIVYVRDYPSSSHPSQKTKNPGKKAELLAEWWKERTLEVISHHYAEGIAGAGG